MESLLSSASIDFVTHSVANIRGYDLFKHILRQGYIKPYKTWKAGFSINGCYAVGGYSIDAVLIFNYKDVRDKLIPVLYFPLQDYDWYQTRDYLITWHNLTWEAEVAMLEGNTIPLSLCKMVVISPRKRKLMEQLKKMGFKVSHMLPYSPLQSFSKFFRQVEGERKFHLSNIYNAWICGKFNLNYEEIKRNFPLMIEQREIKRLNRRCSLCTHFYFDLKLTPQATRTVKCLLRDSPTTFDKVCENFSFNHDLYLNPKGWRIFNP